MNDPRDSALSADNKQRLDDLLHRIAREAESFLGYPCNSVFDYRPLYRFLGYPINNVGDPFVPSNYHLNTHEFEREVVAAFGRLTNAPPEATWGYVTNGGT